MPEVRERVRDDSGAEPPVEILCRLEVRHRLVEAAEPAEGLAAVRERQAAERRESREVGEAKRQVELRDRLHVRALLDVTGSAVGVHADHLQDVPRLLRVVQRPQVVEIVRAAVSVQRGEHRESGVGGCQSLRVVRGGRDLERALRVRPAFLPASAKPVRRSTPREHERDVARLTLRVPAIVGRERLVEAPAQVVEQADSPGERGRDDVGAPGRALEAPKRVLPVATKAERLAGEHLVLWRTSARAEQRDRLGTVSTDPLARMAGPVSGSMRATSSRSPIATRQRSASSGRRGRGTSALPRCARPWSPRRSAAVG